MNESSFYTVIITAVTVLGSASAWRFWEKRAIRKDKEEDFIKNDCRDRISKLEALLTESSKEKDEMRELILSLTEKVAALTVKVEFLQRENNDLHSKIYPKSL
jgi:peptidoglycan hydrolase CwlO-like protein